MKDTDNLKHQYQNIKHLIIRRISEFKSVWDRKNHREIFKEFVFCLLTPQSRAKAAWEAVMELGRTGVLYSGSHKEIEPFLKGVRFYRNKARYIEEARERFFKDNRFLLLEIIDDKEIKQTRNTLVKTVRGYGYKEASHFLRNIGLYRDIAILDRHIMRNMLKYGYLNEIPHTLSPRKYLEIEKSFMKFSEDIDIPPEHLDLLLWYLEAGEVFK